MRHRKAFWKLCLGFLLLTPSQALAADEEFSPQDKLNFSFVSEAHYTETRPKYDGTFTAVKYWKLAANGIPAAQPDLIYAYANVSDAATKGLLRVAFNGTTLKLLPETPMPVWYAVKRAPEPFENWMSWYIHFNPTQFPKALAVDSIGGNDGAFRLAFPAAAKIVHPEPFVIGDRATEIHAATQTNAVANHVEFKLYPSATPVPRASYLWNGIALNPAAPKMGFINTEYGNIAGWQYGNNNGLIGFSACNQTVISAEGGKRYLFKACTLMVKPTAITINRPR